MDWYEASLATTSTADATPTLSATVGAVTDDVLTGLDSVVDPEDLATPSTTGSTTAADVPAVAVEEPSADATAPSADTPAPDGPLPSDPAAALVEPGANPSTAGTGSPVPVGSSPATGLALGLGGVAAVAAVRQGLLGATGSGLVGSATTLAAGVVPAVTGRSSALDRLVRMLTAFRYSRYDDSDPLEHEARAAVFDVVESRPGAYLSEVAERADLPLSTARHHVRVLEREDLLTGAKLRGKRRFYPAYAGDMELAAALNDESTAAVLDALARLGGSSVSELADELGRDPSTVTHHLQRLEEDGLVSREREGRSVINRLSAETRAALEPGTEPAASPEASGVVASD